jgi:hypothetical protein
MVLITVARIAPEPQTGSGGWILVQLVSRLAPTNQGRTGPALVQLAGASPTGS